MLDFSSDRSLRPYVFRIGGLLSLLGLLTLGLVPNLAQAQTPTTTIQNGNTDTRLQLNYDGGLYVPGIFGPTTPADSIPATGAGSRLMWYPAKGAFRAGRVGNRLDGTQWDASKVGNYSAALGVDTKASGQSSVALGNASAATKKGAVAMGITSGAEGSSAVAMGKSSTATGDFAVAIGQQANAEGQSSVALGGFTDATADAAKALGGTASALGAVSMNRGTAAGGNSVAMGEGEATGTRAVAMGRATVAATNQSLSAGTCNSANTTADNTLLAVGNGTFDTGSFSCTNNSDALRLKRNGDLAVGHSTPTARLHAKDNVSGSASSPSNHVGFVENTGGTNSDGLAIKAGPNDTPGSAVNYLTFYDGDGDPIGAIEGDGSGGITQTSGSGDFAEELPVETGAKAPDPAEIVGVQGGKASLDTDDADRVMIASRAPILKGNATPATEKDDDRRVALAFIGQVPVKTRGEAQPGDLIVPSGKEDGTARAVAPSEYRRPEHGPIAGQVWSAKTSKEVGEVTVAVGLGRSGAVAERLQSQQAQIDSLKEKVHQIQDVKKRLAVLEAGRSPSVVAGLSGSGARLLLAFLLGGLFGAGLLWPRGE